jgi:hypothetical protein
VLDGHPHMCKTPFTGRQEEGQQNQGDQDQQGQQEEGRQEVNWIFSAGAGFLGLRTAMDYEGVARVATGGEAEEPLLTPLSVCRNLCLTRCSATPPRPTDEARSRRGSSSARVRLREIYFVSCVSDRVSDTVA